MREALFRLIGRGATDASRLYDRCRYALSLICLACGALALPAHADTPNNVLVAALEQARTTMFVDPDRAFDQARAAESLAVDINNIDQRRHGLAMARWLGAEALLRLNRTDRAEHLVENAIRLAERTGDRKLLADLRLTQGGILGEQVRVADALAAYQAAHRTYASAGDARGQAISLQNIANLYLDGRDFANADRYYLQSQETFDKDPVLLLALYNNRGTSLLLQERFAEAIQEYSRAQDIAQRQGAPLYVAGILTNIAKSQLGLDRFAEAQASLQQAARLSRQSGAESRRRQISGVAAQLAFQRGDLTRARQLIEQTFNGLDLTTTNATFRDAHVTAYEVYNRLGDTQLALEHLQALRRLTDEATRLAASTNTALMAARFDFANQELRIARLKAEELSANIELERSRARFQRTLFLGVGGAGLVIVALLTFGIITIRRSRNQVRAANVELEATNSALARALAAKTEFLATTSHEIRTPLNGILGMTQVMLADRALAGPQRDRVQVVHGAGLTMRALVDDILDVAKMETGNLTIAPEPADLRATLDDVAKMWREQATAKGLSFDLDLEQSPRWIETDASRLRQVVFNLLSNALKFTSEGSIGLRALAMPDGERLRIEVSDSGIGIAPEKQNEIFESFKQADSTTTRQFGGTGLGLTICRNLALALGGTITVESEEGRGSTFVVTLPLIAVEPPVGMGSGNGTDGGLVILDRNPIARSMLRTLLAARTGEIIFADEPADAVRALGDASRLLVDAASLADSDAAILAALEDLVKIVREQSVALYVLWRHPSEAVVAAIRAMEGVQLIEKPIAGPALASRLFDGDGQTIPPLATRAA